MTGPKAAVMDRFAVYAGLIRQQVIGAGIAGLRRGRPAKTARYVWKSLSHIVRDRLLPIEAWTFGDDLDAVRKRRSTLYLQIEHSAHLRPHHATLLEAGLNDKARFAQFCEAYALPHPQTELLDLERPEGAERLSNSRHGNFFIKPATGSGGDGVMALRRVADGQWQLHVARDDMREGDLGALLGHACSTGRFVLQPAVTNATKLAQNIGPALATFRAITAPVDDRGLEVISMLAELPLDNALPMAQRWLVLPVDPSTGVFTPLAAKTLDRLGEHISEEVMELIQRPLIDAPSLPRLAVHAHKTLHSHNPQGKLPPMIGWDLALGQEGPIVLEPNWNWSVATHYSNAAGLDFALSERFAHIAARHSLS